MARLDAIELPISSHHELVAGELAWEHRDPFGRLLATQGHAENVARVTADPAFATLWRTAHSVGAGQLRAVDGTSVVRSSGSIE